MLLNEVTEEGDDEKDPLHVPKRTHQETVERWATKRALLNVNRRFSLGWNKHNETLARIARHQDNRIAKHIKELENAAIPPSLSIKTSGGHSITIPLEISTGRSKFHNPYFFNKSMNRYAGDPSAFPHWAKYSGSRSMYLRLNSMLTSHGLDPFDVMYSNKAHGAYFNFALIGAKGKFIWRKYDLGSTSGRNWCYIDGVKYITSDVVDWMSTNPTKLRTLLDPLV